MELQEIHGLYEAQEIRKRVSDSKIDQYTLEAALHFNKLVSEDLTRLVTSSPQGSVKSQCSRASRVRAASARINQAKIAVEKVTLIEKQTEQKRARALETRVKLLELEMKQKQFEFQHQLELAKLDAEKEMEEARERTEMAELECKLAECEFSVLLSEGNRPEQHNAKMDTNIDENPTSFTEAISQLFSSQVVSGNSNPLRRVVFPISCASSHALPPMFKETFTSCPTCTPPFPVVSSGVPTLPAFFSHDNQSTFASASLFQAVPSSASTLPVTSLRVTDRPPTFTSSSAFPVCSLCAFPGSSSRVPGSPGLARTASCDPAHLYTPGPVYTHATQALGSVGSTSHGTVFTVFCHASTGAQTPSPLIEDPRQVPPSLHPTSECFLATITATMEKMSANHDLLPLQVLKFNGSLERYPLFRQRFHQMVESKSLDEQTKMARLLQFLEGPALRAVQRYEAVSGSLAKSLKVLQNRFGQPFKIVRACIDTLTKGRAIVPQDKEGLQRYADLAQVMYDTLESMGCLGEMNTDSLEKVVLRLPKWLQDKFREHLKKLKRQGRIMPTFKDVVEFLNDRADLAHHPFFTSPSTEVKSLRRNEDRDKPNLRHLTTLTTSSIKEDSRFGRVKDVKPSNCLLCTEFHPLCFL